MNHVRQNCIIFIQIQTMADLPVKYPRFLKYVAEINVCIQEIGIEAHRLLKMVNCKPNFALGIKHATQITPGYGKIGSSFYGFQVTRLHRTTKPN